MNYVPGEEYFSCIVLRRTRIGPFDFGWWASSSWNDLETWKSSISKSTAGAIFCYFANKGLVNLSWKTGRTFALAPPCGRESWHGNRAGPAESHIQTELGVRVLLLCSTVPRSTANESNLSTHTFLSFSTRPFNSPLPKRSDHETFTWYQKYDGFRHLLTSEYLSSAPDATSAGEAGIVDDDGEGLGLGSTIDKKTARVLIVGAGNDELGEEMLRDGWEGGIVNVDFSEVVVQQMREKYDDAFHEALLEKMQRASEDSGSAGGKAANSSGSFIKMTYECHDITKALPYDDGSFDLIICKGTLDAILCSASSAHSARAFMNESCRVLNKDHGALVVVTYGTKESRLVHFENTYDRPDDEWWKGGVTFHSVPKPVVDRNSPRVTLRNANPYHTVIIAKKYGDGGPIHADRRSPRSVQDDSAALRSIGSSLEKRLFIGITEGDEEG